jgi:hypothetical protein
MCAKQEGPMSANQLDLSGEPSLDDVLREPAIRLLMARDGVSRSDIETLAAERQREPRAKELMAAVAGRGGAC